MQQVLIRGQYRINVKILNDRVKRRFKNEKEMDNTTGCDRWNFRSIFFDTITLL